MEGEPQYGGKGDGIQAFSGRRRMSRARLDNVACARGGREVFRAVSLRLDAGEALEVRGANGCGKTSLLRILAGLLAPSEGAATLSGMDAPPCLLGPENALKRDRTAEANLRFWARFLGAPPAALEYGVEMFRLHALLPLPVAWLSLGQRRRLALARLCLSGAGLWLLDEPASGLDRTARESLGAALAAHRQDGGMAVAATHVDLPLPGAAVVRLDAPRHRPAAPGDGWA